MGCCYLQTAVVFVKHHCPGSMVYRKGTYPSLCWLDVAAALAYLSCVSCMYLHSFLLRVLLRNKCWLSGSIACSVSSVGIRCCLMYDGGGNGGRANEHVSVILGGMSASSSSRELAGLVRDVEGGSSLSVDYIYILNAVVVVLISGGTK